MLCADNRIVAHAMYAQPDGDRAEAAFAVADELHGSGIATILLERLAEHAHDNGVARFTAEHEARSALDFVPVPYWDPFLTEGVTQVKAVHVRDVRDGVK